MINLSIPPATEEERVARVRLLMVLENAETRSRRMSGGACSKCNGRTIIVDLAPTTRECESCEYTEEI